MHRLVPFLGIAVFFFIAWLASVNRKVVPWRAIFWGVGLQFLFAISILGIPALKIPGVFSFAFSWLNTVVNKLLGFVDHGSDFVFGVLNVPDQIGGFIFAFRVLPTIIFFSALVTLLYHLGVLQRVVTAMSWVMQKTLKTSGAESLAAAANIFLGQTEAPLLVKPFVAAMTRSELFAIMVPGMASVAGGVLAAFVGMFQSTIPDIAGHLITASFMSAPAALAISKMMVPETEIPLTLGGATLNSEKIDSNIFEAISRGASEGLSLALNVAAMLLVFISMIAMANAVLTMLASWVGFSGGFTLQQILGTLLSPMAWLMGINWSEAGQVGGFLGEKVALNEFVAYASMSKATDVLSERTLVIASYALCGFANFSSIGIQLGGIGGMAPNQRSKIAELGLRCVLAGNLASFMTASVVAILIE